MPFEDFKREAHKLPVDDREDLAYSLLHSLDEAEEDDGEHERLWRNEIERRYQEYKEGKAELFDADEVLAELRAETV
ncbi:MAG TPA: addiction module protein [Thermoanaerobaculia bacterium]|nr:addiction module protein [Thermoanaerobaculia bacterium]